MNPKHYYRLASLRSIFGPKIRTTSLKHYIKKSQIPEPSIHVINTQKLNVWEPKDLPEIGKVYGWLKVPETADLIIIAVYLSKGGVLKTTLAYNFARILAINGIDTLLIGLDTQQSLNALTLEHSQYFNLETFEEAPGLMEYFLHKEKLENIILQTDLPTLNVIPENTGLEKLEKYIATEKKRSNFLANMISSLPSKYKVVILDCAPGYNVLTENALMCCDHLISPMSTEVGTLQIAKGNMQKIESFLIDSGKNLKSHSIVPTLVMKTKLSDSILSYIKTAYKENVTLNSIRRSTVGQSQLLSRRSAIEEDGTSDVSQDIKKVVTEIWEERITNQ